MHESKLARIESNRILTESRSNPRFRFEFGASMIRSSAPRFCLRRARLPSSARSEVLCSRRDFSSAFNDISRYISEYRLHCPAHLSNCTRAILCEVVAVKLRQDVESKTTPLLAEYHLLPSVLSHTICHCSREEHTWRLEPTMCGKTSIEATRSRITVRIIPLSVCHVHAWTTKFVSKGNVRG